MPAHLMSNGPITNLEQLYPRNNCQRNYCCNNKTQFKTEILGKVAQLLPALPCKIVIRFVS